MSHKVDLINYKGFNINIIIDADPESPRTFKENLGTMTCFHKKYDLGDDCAFYNPDDLENYFENEDHIKLPIYMYEHGGITISTRRFSCPWDSGKLGYIYASREKIINEGLGDINNDLDTTKKVLDIFEEEIKEYDLYLKNEIYGYIIPETNDSCWGFYGDIYESGLIEDAKAKIDSEIKYRRKVRFAKIKDLITNRVPLEIRKSILQYYTLIT